MNRQVKSSADHTNHETQTRLAESMPKPYHSPEDKAESLLNVLRGYEELTTDTNGIIISSNLEIVCITGYEEWEVIGKHISIFYTEEDVKSRKPEEDFKKAELSGPIRDEGWKVKKRGARFWAKTKIFAMYDSLHNLTGYRVILRDETHKAFHNYKLSQRKKAQVEFYNYSTIGLMEFHFSSGRVTLMNGYAQNLLGVNKDVVFFNEIFGDPSKYDELISLIDRDRHTNNFEFELINGRWVSLDCKFFFKNGMVEVLLTEITDRKKREQEVMNLNEELQMFLYHASHDLRSPLTSIFGLLNLIEMEGTPVETKYTRMIKSRVDHLDSLLRELTAVTFNNARPISTQQFLICDELDFVLEGLDTSEIVFGVDVDEKLSMNTDVLRLRVVLKHIISNAIRYKDAGKQVHRVNVSIKEVPGNRLLFEVIDNGIGMTEDQLTKIFKPFYRGHSSMSGHGLGLYVARSMVKVMGGTIKMESTPGKGTSVQIYLRKDQY